MRGIWIALAFFAAYAAWADPQPPAPSPAKVEQPQQSQTKGGQQRTATDQNITTKPPSEINLLKSGKASEKNNQDSKDTENKPSADWWMVRLTAALAVLAFLQWIAFLCQARYMRQTTEAMREDHASTHRPEISVLSFEPSHEGIEEEKIAVQVMYVNRGRSTAKNVRIQATITNREFPLQTGIGLGGPDAIDLPHPDLASGIKNYFLIASEILAKSVTIQSMRESRGQGTARIVCIGCISYFDGMNGRRETGFCRVFNAASERWESSGNTEYEYSY